MANQKEITIFEVNVIDARKKSSFNIRRLKDFPVASTIEIFRENIVKYLPDLAAVVVPNFRVGYVLERNKKFDINNKEELKEAFDQAINGYPFWIDPHESAEVISHARGSKGAKRKFIWLCVYQIYIKCNFA